MTKTHELKSWPVFFEQLAGGAKGFEVRKDDRGFAVGDMLVIREWDPKTQVYSGRSVHARVTYRLGRQDFSEGIEPGFVVLSIQRMSRWEAVPLGG